MEHSIGLTHSKRLASQSCLPLHYPRTFNSVTAVLRQGWLWHETTHDQTKKPNQFQILLTRKCKENKKKKKKKIINAWNIHYTSILSFPTSDVHSVEEKYILLTQ